MEGAGAAASTFLDGWTVWEFPGKPVSVRLNPEVVARLGMAVRQDSKVLPRRALETGGLLIGSRTKTGDPVVVQVDDFEPVETEHANGPSYLLSDPERRRLAAGIEAREATGKNSSIVGFYRSHTRPGFDITEEDVHLFSTCFKNASDVFLLIKPNDDGSSTGGFIIRERGEVVSNSPYREFPLPGNTVVRKTPLPALRESPELPPSEPVLRRVAAQAAFWLPALGVLALAVGLYWGIPASAPGSTAVKPIPSRALSVAFIGNDLRLSWDHEIWRRAGQAVLWIQDGPETLKLKLDSKQLSEGSVVYSPKSGDVDFRFEALSPGATWTESVRAIRASSQAAVVPPSPETVAVEAPSVPPAAPKTRRRNGAAPPVSAANRPSPNGIGTAARQMSGPLELSRKHHTPVTVAAIPLPDPPTVQPAVVPPSNSKDFLKLIASAEKRDAAVLPFRVSVDPVPASRRGFPPILKRSVRSDYIAPAPHRDPGLLNPPHRNVPRIVTIDVKVYVNPAGKVDYSEALSTVAESDRDLAALAVFSARRWEFVPARTRDGAVPSEVILHYQFGPSARETGSGNLAAR